MVDTSYILIVMRGRIGELSGGRLVLGGSCVHGDSRMGCIGTSGRGRVVSAILIIGYSMRLFTGTRLRGRWLGGCSFGDGGGGRIHFAGAVRVLGPLLLQ